MRSRTSARAGQFNETNMNIEDVREYCLSKNYSSESTPFDEDTLVYKVGTPELTKMFALTSLSRSNYLLLKCDPERAIELRDKHPEIESAFHMNKRHWNGVIIDGDLSDEFIHSMIDDSYKLVCATFPKRIKLE